MKTGMHPARTKWVVAFGLLLCFAGPLAGRVVFEKFSPYHYVQVIDEDGFRVLSFNGASETRMSLANPLQGHFEYTEYFQMPWLWNHNIRRVLMIGLGGGSTQRAYGHYHTNVMVDTVEIDPVVIEVAKKYFAVKETPRHSIHNEDGRVFLRRTAVKYDVILMDAYTRTRYGSSIPPHLVTKEFFQLADRHLTTNGVLAYNVIGQVQGSQADIVGAIYRTMKEVFPQVYTFPAHANANVVLIGTKSREPFNPARVRREAAALLRSGVSMPPTFAERSRSFRSTAPPAAANSPVLTDEYAPVEQLSGSTR